MAAKSIVGVLLLWLAGLISPLGAAAQDGDVAVIVNPNSTVTHLSLTDLRKIFAGEKRSWPGGIPIKLIVQPPGCHERRALLRLLGMSEEAYKQYWTAQVFRGEAEAEPLTVPSFGMVKEAAKVFPGAISLVDAQNVKPGAYMRVIKVEGLLPGDPGYPVH